MAAGRPAEKSKLVLERDNIYVAGVEKVGGVPVRPQVLFFNFKSNDGRVPVTALNVIDWHREASDFRMPRPPQPQADRM